jgi:ribosomal protein S12 methylthiotransferase accessory factor
VKGFLRGTHRAVSPAATIARISPMMRAAGITRVADVTGLDAIGIPVVMVCRPNARSVAVSQGKGLDLDSARASGIMEALEQWHAEHIIQPVRYAAASELAGHRLVELARLPRHALGAFDPHQKRLWIDGEALLGGGTCLLPFEVVHTDYTVPAPPGAGCFLTTSTGLASGNERDEAIVHGLYEVIERDAIAVWHAGGKDRRRQTRVDRATIDDPDCLELLARFDRAGVAVGVWDATSDIGVPVFVAELVDREPHPFRVLCVSGGYGCHRTRGIALARALTEAAQSRLTIISGARDDLDRASYERHRAPQHIAATLDEIVNALGPRSYTAIPDAFGETFEDDLAAVLVALRGADVNEVVVVDLTRPELALPVVRVVVPGLESVSEAPGYIAGRRAREARAS